MFQMQNQFSCSECRRVIDIGEPFLASATYPARSYMQSESVDANFLQEQGEVLCKQCALKRLGDVTLSKLKGAVFEVPTIPIKHRHKVTK